MATAASTTKITDLVIWKGKAGESYSYWRKLAIATLKSVNLDFVLALDGVHQSAEDSTPSQRFKHTPASGAQRLNAAQTKAWILDRAGREEIELAECKEDA